MIRTEIIERRIVIETSDSSSMGSSRKASLEERDKVVQELAAPIIEEVSSSDSIVQVDSITVEVEDEEKQESGVAKIIATNLSEMIHKAIDDNSSSEGNTPAPTEESSDVSEVNISGEEASTSQGCSKYSQVRCEVPNANVRFTIKAPTYVLVLSILIGSLALGTLYLINKSSNE